MGKPLVSIVIPVFNKEQYLSECLDSVIHQTYGIENLEVICVNDGSTDKSALIVEQYKAVNNNIILINKENSGVSSARNCGIIQAKGKYILFLDADDSISDNTVLDIVLYFDSIYDEVDILTYNIYYKKNGKIRKGERGKGIKTNCIIDVEKEFSFSQTTMNVCVKNDKKILFDESLDISEDQVFNTETVKEKCKIGWCNTAKYFYARDASGKTASFDHPFYSYDMLISSFHRFLEIGENNKKMDDYCKSLILYNLSWRIKADYLFPYHKNGGTEILDGDMQKIIDSIDNELIFCNKWLKEEHKYYVAGLKRKNKLFPILQDGAWWFCDTSNMLHSGKLISLISQTNGKNITLVIQRERIKGNNLFLMGFLKSPIFSYTEKPILKMDINGKTIYIDLYESANSMFWSKIKTGVFWGFEITITIHPNDRINFFVEVEGKTFNVSYWFREWNNINSVTKNFIHFSNPVSLEFSQGMLIARAYDDVKEKHKKAISSLRHKHFGRYCLYKLAQFFKKFPIWLYCDFTNVFDNGLLQFKHDLKKKDGVFRFYVYFGEKKELRKRLNFWERLHTIKFKSFLHRLLFITSSKILTSYNAVSQFVPYTKAFTYYNDLINFETIYLQHGVMHAQCDNLYAKDRSPFVDKIIASTFFEESYFYEKLNYKKNDIISTCQPRFTYLKIKDSLKQKNVLFAPSWRNYLVRRASTAYWESIGRKFEESGYYKNILSFISGSGLNELLVKHRIRMDIKLHPNFSMYKDLFNTKSQQIKIVDNINFEDYKLLITDFSSFQFDFIYLNIPVIHFLPDAAQFKSGLHSYKDFIFPLEQTGKIAYTPEELLVILENNLANNTIKNSMFLNSLFVPHHQQDVCEEIYKKIKGS